MAGEDQGNPAAQPVEQSGVQAPGSEAPASGEAQSSENTGNNAPASGFGQPGKDHRVPYDRFQKVNSQRKEAEAKAAELQEQLEMLRQQPTQQPPSQVNEQIESLRQMASEHFHDPVKYTEAMSKIAQLSAQGTANTTLEGLLTQQQQQYQQQAFQSVSEQSWQQAEAEFPELKDQNSELFKAAAMEYDSDPGLQNSPTGMYRAVQAAALRRMMQGGGVPQVPAQLEGSAPAPPATGEGDFKQDLTNALNSGRAQDTRNLLAKHQLWKRHE